MIKMGKMCTTEEQSLHKVMEGEWIEIKGYDYKTGEPHTAHTTNPVPIILVTDNKDYKLKNEGKLADLAPTMLDLMGINKPEEMTGESLLIKE